MGVLFFQGFDIHQRISAVSGLNAGGDDDAAQQFFGGTLVRLSYDEGYLHGRCIKHDRWETLQIRFQDVSGGARLGFWLKGTSVTPGNSSVARFQMGGTFINLRANSDGSLYLTRGTNPLDAGTPFSGTSSPGTLSNDWKHFEMRVNYLNGTASVWVNGVQIISGTFPSQSSDSIRFDLGGTGTDSLSTSWHLYFDHLYITDNAGLSGSQIESVSIDTSQDRYEGVNGFRGTLIINNQRYVTPWYGAAISSLNTFGGVFGYNVCNTVTYFFHRNPSDNSQWTNTSFNAIESWGVCFQEFNQTTLGDRARLDALVLSRLAYNNGMPVVHYDIPGVLTQYSGPWEKTNPDKTLGAHVNTIPRPDVAMRADAESLYIGYPGCILFTKVDSESGEVPYGRVGLTFAERNQVNHRDWTSVDGVGEAADAYFISGYGVYGESNKKFQNNYITVNYETTPGGRAHIQGIWDWSIDPNTGAWSMRQEVYGPKASTDYKHASAKLKIRGHGKALQLKVSSVHDAPFILNGWAAFVTSNTNV